MKPLGRRVPTDWKHVSKYKLVVPTIAYVEKTLSLPYWHWEWDQGNEGACVGFGTTMMMSILNRRRYDPRWLYQQAQLVDEWPETPPEEGTSVRAACDILRDRGHVRVYRGKTYPESLTEGIQENRWATTVDEMRTCIAKGVPLSVGIDWYTEFDHPQKVGYDYWIAKDGNLTSIRGGHCVCFYGASDRRQAFKIKNSWGRDYPLVYLPYSVMAKLFADEGEVTLVTDRI